MGLVIAILTLLICDVEAQTPTPQASGLRVDANSGFTGHYTEYFDEFDDFWRSELNKLGFRYTSPKITQITSDINTKCGRMFADDWNAYYCSAEQEIFLFPRFMELEDAGIGDFAPMFIVAHEWGHHVQHLAGIRQRGAEFELQADCLGGVFSRYAERQGWLERGDIIEGLELAESIGDDVLGQDTDDPHGTYIERRDAVMRGLLDGLHGCDFPKAGDPRPTQAPTRTDPTPTSTHFPPTPTPIVDNMPNTPFPNPRIPTTLPLAHAACFSIVDGGPLTYTELLDRFSGYSEAGTLLLGWGWHGSAYQQFGCNGPPEGDAGWIDISIHGFSSAAAAQEAADYFAGVRLDGTSLRRADGPGVGDYSVALIGPASNGTEFTVYATRGPWLVRVTGVSPSGIPFMNVRAVALDVLDAQDVGGAGAVPTADGSVSAPTIPSSSYLPAAPNLNYADCFSTHTSGTFGRSEVAAAFAMTTAGKGAVDSYGWQDGAYVVFRCDDPPFGRAEQIDLIIHQFRDASAARQVEGAVKDFHIPGDRESRACDTAGPLVICVTGYADSGSPLSDVYFVLHQVVADAG